MPEISRKVHPRIGRDWNIREGFCHIGVLYKNKNRILNAKKTRRSKLQDLQV